MCEFGQIICEFVNSLEKWGLYHIGEDFNKWKYIAIDIKIWEGVKIRIVYICWVQIQWIWLKKQVWDT